MPLAKITILALRNAGDYFRTRGEPMYATPSMTRMEALRDREMMNEVGELAIEANRRGWLPNAAWLTERIEYHSTNTSDEPVNGAEYVRCPVNLFCDIVSHVHRIAEPDVPLEEIDSRKDSQFRSQAATCDLLAHWIERHST